jgi:hypothetical protein
MSGMLYQQRLLDEANFDCDQRASPNRQPGAN